MREGRLSISGELPSGCALREQIASWRTRLESVQKMHDQVGFSMDRADADVRSRLTRAFELLEDHVDELEAAMLQAVVEQSSLRHR